MIRIHTLITLRRLHRVHVRRALPGRLLWTPLRDEWGFEQTGNGLAAGTSRVSGPRLQGNNMVSAFSSMRKRWYKDRERSCDEETQEKVGCS